MILNDIDFKLLIIEFKLFKIVFKVLLVVILSFTVIVPDTDNFVASSFKIIYLRAWLEFENLLGFISNLYQIFIQN